MNAACLYAAHDMRLCTLQAPTQPQAGEVLLKVGSVGVCGSDLRNYIDGEIGEIAIKQPFVLGHEFAGTVAAVGANATDGKHQPLVAGQRVAVEPAIACWHCDQCERGNPNLCRNLRFMGLTPEQGALREYMIVPARNCFPLPDSLSLEAGALLEPLGVAIHAVDLAHLRVGQSVAVLGCGMIGLMILQVAKKAGAYPIYAFDQYAWRLETAKNCGADFTLNIKDGDPVAALRALTPGVEVVFEAAWADESVAQSVEMADLGGKVIFVGIPSQDTVSFKQSSARRKGLTLKMCRRMKHTYPRAIQLAMHGGLQLESLVTHRFGLETAADAFALNTAYEDDVVKVLVNLG